MTSYSFPFFSLFLLVFEHFFKKINEKKDDMKNRNKWFHIVIYVIFGLLICVVHGQVISRANWGALFHQTSHIINGASIYAHTFAIPLPEFPELNLGTVPCESDSDVHQFIHCAAANDLLSVVKKNSQEKIDRANE